MPDPDSVPLLGIAMMAVDMEDDDDAGTIAVMNALAELEPREWWILVGALAGYAKSAFEHHAEDYGCDVGELYEGLAWQVLMYE